jgi:predicted metal-dependent phosphoesterase TrpH
MSTRYDLHAHTTASDGTFSPRELVELAKKNGLSGVAVCDHDTTDGIEEALEAGTQYGIEIVPGVEINTEYEGKEVHVLGYYFDRSSTVLQDLFLQLREERLTRMDRILQKLRTAGIQISEKDVLAEAKGASVGRPHIARVLVRMGYASDIRDAFDRWIGKGRPGYVERFKLHPGQAVRLIREAGGVPVIAHPGLVGKDAIVEELIPEGLLGLEALHPDHSPEERKRFSQMAENLGLIATGGSDFHGAGAEHRGDLGSVYVDEHVVAQLKKRSLMF